MAMQSQYFVSGSILRHIFSMSHTSMLALVAMVLVDALGSATVNLKAHFWIDGRTISPQRIRSSALRVIKRSLVEHGVSMPDEAREIIFPQGVPLVRMNSDGTEPDKMSVALTASAAGGPPPSAAEPNLEATSAEGGLGNEMT